MTEGHQKRGVAPEELAALLDGEMQSEQAARISDLLATDSNLHSEYGVQREAKLALAALKHEPAPSFMATRVLAAIEVTRRRQARIGVLRAVAGSVVMFTAGFGAAVQYMQQPEAPSYAAGRAYPAGLTRATDDYFADLPDSRLVLPAGTDPRAEQYLNVLQQAHSYSQVLRVNSAVASPSLDGAILVLDEGGR